MAEMEELGGAAFEIIDQAPEREYWDSFHTRVCNRILSRAIAPEPVREKSSRLLVMRLALSTMAALAMVFVVLIIARPVSKSP